MSKCLKKSDIVFPDGVDKYIKLQEQGNFYVYYNDPTLFKMNEFIVEKDYSNILDIGCGIGRASVYFFKLNGYLKDSVFYLLDGNSGEKTFSFLRHNRKNDFYNNISITKRYCSSNGLKSVFINIEEDVIPDVKFDLVYSTHAIGFHWNLSLYLGELIDKLNHGAVLLFTIRAGKNKSEIKWNKKQINYVNSIDNYEIVSIVDMENKGEKILVLKFI